MEINGIRSRHADDNPITVLVVNTQLPAEVLRTIVAALATTGGPPAAAPLVSDLSPNDEQASPWGRAEETLTRRELEVAKLAALGMSNADIADQLVVTVSTVKNHVSSALKKLGLKTRIDFALMGRKAESGRDR